MKCTARFYKLNYDFSPEFAEAHHKGEESENNRFYDWQDELVITTDVKDVNVLENSVYIIQGKKNGENFSEEVPNMMIFQIIGENDEITIMACSHSMLNKYVIERDKEKNIININIDK